MGSSNSFERRGLLGLPVTLPSIPILNPLLTPLLGGSTPTPTSGVNIPNVTLPPQPVPTLLTTSSNPDPGDGNVPANGGDGGGSTPTSTNQGSGSGNTNLPNPNPNSSPNLSTPAPNPDYPGSNPTPNPGSPGSNRSNPSSPSPTSGLPPSQSSGRLSSGSLQLPGPTQQDSDSGSSGNQEDVVLTTISGVRTEITKRPNPTNGNIGNYPTGGGDDGPINGGGNGSNPSGGRGLTHGAITAIIIGVVLGLALLVFFLRKCARKTRTAHHTRWLSSDESGRRTTFRSSFGFARGSTLVPNFEDDDESLNEKRHSGPFSDSMAVPPPTPASASPPTPQMAQAIHIEIAPPTTVILSTGRRSSRISQFSIGSSESDMSDNSGVQWVEIRPNVGYNDNGGLSPTYQRDIPSPISVRPFTPTESWSFPKPPTSRAQSMLYNSEIKGLAHLNPFADPVPQPPQPPAGLLEAITKTFELRFENGDEASVFRSIPDKSMPTVGRFSLASCRYTVC